MASKTKAKKGRAAPPRQRSKPAPAKKAGAEPPASRSEVSEQSIEVMPFFDMEAKCRNRAPKFLRVREAVDYLDGKISEHTVRAWILHRKIETVRLGARVFIPKSALDDMIVRGTRAASRGQAHRRSA